MKEVFYEAAVDSPTMFEDGFTHYSIEKGFHKLEINRDMDDIIRYVSLIDKTETYYESTKKNMPHPKWYEYRKRVDNAEKNKDGEWKLRDVFVEASTHYFMPLTLMGIPHKKGFGIVERKDG